MGDFGGRGILGERSGGIVRAHYNRRVLVVRHGRRILTGGTNE